MARILALLAFTFTFTLAPALSAQGSPPIRSGTYDLEITFGGGVMNGTLEIAVPGDSTLVTLRVGDHVSPVGPTLRKGNRLVLDNTAPGDAIHYDLLFRADSVTGPFTFGGNLGSVAGRRRASPPS
ncbi:MAG: hypothetical protein ABJC74_00950 [Gemmatimonadota bacterium]